MITGEKSLEDEAHGFSNDMTMYDIVEIFKHNGSPVGSIINIHIMDGDILLTIDVRLSCVERVPSKNRCDA